MIHLEKKKHQVAHFSVAPVFCCMEAVLIKQVPLLAGVDGHYIDEVHYNMNFLRMLSSN